MTGLDKIVSQILEEANNSASAKLEKPGQRLKKS